MILIKINDKLINVDHIVKFEVHKTSRYKYIEKKVIRLSKPYFFGMCRKHYKAECYAFNYSIIDDELVGFNEEDASKNLHYYESYLHDDVSVKTKYKLFMLNGAVYYKPFIVIKLSDSTYEVIRYNTDDEMDESLKSMIKISPNYLVK